MMRRGLCCAAILMGLLSPGAAWAQVAPNANRSVNRNNDAATTSDNAQPNAQTQTNATRHSGPFRSFHSFSAPPRM